MTLLCVCDQTLFICICDHGRMPHKQETIQIMKFYTLKSCVYIITSTHFLLKRYTIILFDQST